MFEVPLLIGGKARAASDGGTFERRHPVSGEVVSVVAAATLADADAAVEAAQAAFPAWAALGPGERRARLLKAADALDARRDEFLAMAGETGAKANWYGFNVMLAANILREAASMTTQIQGSVIPSDVPGSFAMALRQPCGVVLGIAPWNAPVILATRAIAMPLACGNTVVLKASEASPAVHGLIGQVLQAAGLGDGVVNVICNAPHDAPAVVERPGLPMSGASLGNWRRVTSSLQCSNWVARHRSWSWPMPTWRLRSMRRPLVPTSTRARFACRPSG